MMPEKNNRKGKENWSGAGFQVFLYISTEVSLFWVLLVERQTSGQST